MAVYRSSSARSNVRDQSLGFAAKGGLSESGDQLLQPFDPLVLADFTKLRGD
jgi:hypothetical protein